jgi:thiamine kinase
VTGLLSPETALSRIPAFADATFSKMGGGLTNRSYIVRSGGGTYALRLDAEHTAAFGLDRATELRILHDAAQASLAPEVRFADPAAGILLYDYLPGPIWERASLDSDNNLARVSALLRTVHRLPEAGAPLDALKVAHRYEALASRSPDLRPHAERCVEIIRRMPEPAEVRCCHNDVVAANIVGTVSGNAPLRLLDWEYACDNDPYYDLASLVAYHDLTSKQADRLLDSYTGMRMSESRERLALQLRRYDAIQWLWFAARYAIDRSRTHRTRLEELRPRIR